jgi:hypothetical protein
LKLNKELINCKVKILKKLLNYIFDIPFSFPMDVENLCKYLGINLVPFEGTKYSYKKMIRKDPELSGFGDGGLAYATWVNNEPEIWFNKFLTPQWKRLFLAHELGHIIDVSEKRTSLDDLSKIDFINESRAIFFSAEITLPTLHSLMLFNKGSFKEIMNIFQIPPFIAITRIMSLLKKHSVCYMVDRERNILLMWTKVPKLKFSQRFYIDALKSLEEEMKIDSPGIPYFLLDADSKCCFAYEPGKKHLKGLESFKILPLVREAFSSGLFVSEWAKRGKLQWYIELNKKRYEVMSDSPYWFASVYPIKIPELFSKIQHSIALIFLIEDAEKELVSLWKEKKQGLLSDSLCKEIIQPFKKWKQREDFPNAIWAHHISKIFTN